MKVVNEHTRPPRPIPPRDGSKLIKGFVQQAEQRRVACRVALLGLDENLPHGLQDIDVHMLHIDRTHKEEESTAAIIGGLFATKQVQRNRQISLTPAMLPAATAAAASGL
ncbi:hypothetical protein JG687_00002980, partial [Phytophthora cactorum]